MLSELFLAKEISVRLSAMACATGISPSATAVLRHRLRRRRTTSPTSSLDITSQRPSLARIRHSSSSVLVVKVTSGTGIIHGLRYLSPEISTLGKQNNFENNLCNIPWKIETLLPILLVMGAFGIYSSQFYWTLTGSFQFQIVARINKKNSIHRNKRMQKRKRKRKK